MLCRTIRSEQGKDGTFHATVGQVTRSLVIGIPHLIYMADGPLLPLLIMLYWYVTVLKLPQNVVPAGILFYLLQDNTDITTLICWLTVDWFLHGLWTP